MIAWLNLRIVLPKLNIIKRTARVEVLCGTFLFSQACCMCFPVFHPKNSEHCRSLLSSKKCGFLYRYANLWSYVLNVTGKLIIWNHSIAFDQEYDFVSGQGDKNAGKRLFLSQKVKNNQKQIDHRRWSVFGGIAFVVCLFATKMEKNIYITDSFVSV